MKHYNEQSNELNWTAYCEPDQDPNEIGNKGTDEENETMKYTNAMYFFFYSLKSETYIE